MILHILWWLFSSVATFAIGLPITALGLVMVAIGLPFRRVIGEPRPFLQFSGEWQMIRLPTWLLPWDNAFDGLMGDKRGWWNNYCLENYGKPATHPYCLWRWAAMRNPANYWSRNITGIDVTNWTISKLAGDDVVTEDVGTREWQFLVAKHKHSPLRLHRFFCFIALPGRPDKGIMFDIGWKIRLSHNEVTKDSPETDRIKGSVLTLSPWKSA